MVVFGMTCCNNVYDFFLVLNGVDPPVLHDELELCDVLTCFLFLVIFVEAATHDGDEHIQHVDTHEETKEKEKYQQEPLDESSTSSIVINIELT